MKNMKKREARIILAVYILLFILFTKFFVLAFIGAVLVGAVKCAAKRIKKEENNNTADHSAKPLSQAR